VVYLIIALLQIFHRVQQWKNFENRLCLFDKDMDKTLWLTFLGHPVDVNESTVGGQSIFHRTQWNARQCRPSPPRTCVYFCVQRVHGRQKCVIDWFYRVATKKLCSKFLTTSSANIGQFSKLFTGLFSGQFVIKRLLNIPTHLNCVATVRCEI